MVKIIIFIALFLIETNQDHSNSVINQKKRRDSPELDQVRVKLYPTRDITHTLSICTVFKIDPAQVVTAFKYPPSCFALTSTVTPWGREKGIGLYQFLPCCGRPEYPISTRAIFSSGVDLLVTVTWTLREDRREMDACIEAAVASQLKVTFLKLKLPSTIYIIINFELERGLQFVMYRYCNSSVRGLHQSGVCEAPEGVIWLWKDPSMEGTSPV
jgi:hypothetical protein